MITCKKCKKIAKFHYIKFNNFSEEWKDFFVKCAEHGITEGEFDDFEELPIELNNHK